MRYTQGQIRELLGIPVETFRTWRDAVPALAQHRGHGPTFTPGEVVALAVVAELVRDYGIRVGAMSSRLIQLFEHCRGLSWLALESCCVLIESESVNVVKLDDFGGSAPRRAMFVFPCAPIVARLRATLSAADPVSTQGHLQFPPTVVTAGRRAE